MGELIKLILTCQKNYYLSERINQLFIFFRHKFGTAYGNRFLLAFAKEILLKTEPLLLKAKSKKEIYLILEEYFHVEF